MRSTRSTTRATHDYGPARLTLLAELRRVIDERQLVLYFQPKAALRSGEVASVEALLRWRHPERGLVFPDEFIASVQQTGLIKPLTLYVIDEALRQCRSWEERGLILSVAVNLSIRNVLDISFPGDVERLLRRHELDPHRLELEITESTMLADPLRTKSALEKLSAMGVRISLDDFGTGYSSLAYLTRLPLDELKIDRSFVLNMLEDTDHAVIVRSTIDLGRNLGLEVVAEGVESAAIWDELGRLGCDVAQGLLLDATRSRRRARGLAAESGGRVRPARGRGSRRVSGATPPVHLGYAASARKSSSVPSSRFSRRSKRPAQSDVRSGGAPIRAAAVRPSSARRKTASSR
jgi:EAL domain-containing protein (putative c-di-GMP-specific phosphodiesterase class I)